MSALTPVHVYDEGGTTLAAAVRRAAPERTVIGWSSPQELAQGLADAELLFVAVPPAASFARAARLRLIQLLGAGADGLLDVTDLPAGVAVAGLGDEFAAHTSEYVIAALLAHVRGVATLVRQHDRREWRPHPAGALSGSTLGILGLGPVGRRVACVAAALGMRVLGLRRRLGPVAHVERVFAPHLLPELLGEVDYLAIALPLTAATRGLLSADMLACLRPHAVIVNAGRGALVDERALARMLHEGRLGGAVLDVFREEPLPGDSPLWTAPRTLVTPHVAGLGRDYVAKAVAVLLENAARLERGDSPRHLIDRELCGPVASSAHQQ